MKGFNKEIYRLLCGIVIAVVVVVVEVIVMAVIVVGSQQQMASLLLLLSSSRTNHGWSITSTHTHPIYQYDPINRLWIQIKQQIDIFVKETQSTAKTVRENDRRRRGGGGGGTIRGRRKRGMRYRASLQWMFQVKIGMKTPSIRIMMTVMLMLTVMIVAVIVLMMLLVMLLIVMRKRVGRWIGPSLLLLLLLRPLEFHTVHTGTGSGHVGSLDTGA